MENGKVYYRWIRNLFGLKEEMSVLPIGFTVFSSPHYPGSVSNVYILSCRKDRYELEPRKVVHEKQMGDIKFLADEYPDNRAVLCDNGYQGA